MMCCNQQNQKHLHWALVFWTFYTIFSNMALLEGLQIQDMWFVPLANLNS